MLIAKRHPTMKRALHSEKGVVGTYSAAVIALVGAIVGGSLFLGSAKTADDGELAAISAEIVPVWVDPALQGVVDESSAVARPSKSSALSMPGADLDADQPVYDEAAGVLIGRRN